MGNFATSEETNAPRVSDCDTWFKVKNPKGIVLLTHGLNLKPAKLDALAGKLNEAGFSVFRPAFTGHCGHNKHYLNVTATHWERDAREFHAIVTDEAQSKGVPAMLCAYSFSAAIFQSMAKELKFDRRVYLAPALSLRFWFPVASFLANSLPRVTYRSMNVGGYYANATSGMLAVQALEHFVGNIDTRGNDSTPTQIWVDPKDELVSYKGIRIQARRRPKWRLEPLTNKGSRMRPAYHHLIINEEALGHAEWERLTSGITGFLGG